MRIHINRRLRAAAGYAFEELDRRRTALQNSGLEIIDFGVGDPQEPTPAEVRAACIEGVEQHAASGYPSYRGELFFRQAAARWMKQRFGVDVDPEREILATAGAKEAVFHFPLAVLDSGDTVLIPDPGYPPYHRGTLFAGGRSVFVRLTPEDRFLPELNSIPEKSLARLRVVWINSPNNPTGAVYSHRDLERIVGWAKKHHAIVASDECYSEIYRSQPPVSILNICRQGVVAFHSLSKRSRMTAYRIGWVAGDPDIIDLMGQVKTQIDSGIPQFVQRAAVAALTDEEHVDQQRQLYSERMDILVEAFQQSGLPSQPAAGSFYLWQRTPAGLTAVQFALKLLGLATPILVTPGPWLCSGPPHAGEGFVRLAMIPSLELCHRAAATIRRQEWNA